MGPKSREGSEASPEYYEALGRAIQTTRTGRGMSRRELAERAGISYPYLSEIENGKKRASSAALIEIAAVLGMRPHHLLEMAESIGPPADAVSEAAHQPPDWFGSHRIMTASMAPPSSAVAGVGRTRATSSPRDEAHSLIEALDDRDLPVVISLLRRLV